LAEQAADAYVSEDWIVLALFQDVQVGKVLESIGLTEQNATEFIQSQRQGRTVESKNDEETRNALEKFTQSPTQRKGCVY
jgi:ATP-dependent Clp protease ATP-binding subunit ClpA